MSIFQEQQARRGTFHISQACEISNDTSSAIMRCIEEFPHFIKLREDQISMDGIELQLLMVEI